MKYVTKFCQRNAAVESYFWCECNIWSHYSWIKPIRELQKILDLHSDLLLNMIKKNERDVSQIQNMIINEWINLEMVKKINDSNV